MSSFWSSFIEAEVHGFIMTLKILALSMPLSILLGLGLGVARVYGNKVVSLFASSIVVLFRGFPLVVTLLVLFFGLSDLGLHLSPFWAAVIGFVLCSGSYQSEYVRGALNAVDKGQVLAARALGMTRVQEITYIVLPQALRIALPGITNELIYMIKYSSLAFIIGVQEIFGVAVTFNSRYFRPVEIFITIAFLYLAMTAIATIISRIIEKRTTIPGVLLKA